MAVEIRRTGATREAEAKQAETQEILKFSQDGNAALREIEARGAAGNSAASQEARRQPPQPPTEGPLPSDQINLTDEDSRIMPMAGDGFEQCYNAQAAVAAGSLRLAIDDQIEKAKISIS